MLGTVMDLNCRTALEEHIHTAQAHLVPRLSLGKKATAHTRLET